MQQITDSDVRKFSRKVFVKVSDNPRIKVWASVRVSMASFLWQKQSLFELQRNQLFYAEKSNFCSASNEVDIITYFWFFVYI